MNAELRARRFDQLPEAVIVVAPSGVVRTALAGPRPDPILVDAQTPGRDGVTPPRAPDPHAADGRGSAP